MIIEWVLDLVFGIMELVAMGLPSIDVDWSGVGTSMANVGDAAGAANGWFPVSALGVGIATILTAEIGMYLFRVTMFVYRKIPGKGT